MTPAFRRLLLITIMAAPSSAQAQGGSLIDNFGDWSAFVRGEGGDRICYVGSVPAKEEGKYERRGDAFVFVTHWPAEKSFDVISVKAGYTYNEGSEMTVLIGGQSYSLFTKGGTAWARDAKADRTLVEAMKAGLTMTVKGISSRGTLTTDTYSLTGFTAAHRAISKACGVQ